MGQIAMSRLRLACFAVLLLMTSPLAAAGQTVGAAPQAGIGLTADHKRTIYSEVGGDKVQQVPDANAVAIGR